MNDKQQEIIQEQGLQDLVEAFFQSPDNYIVPVGDDGTMENWLFDNMLFTLQNAKKLQQDIREEFGVELRLEHGFRHQESIARLKSQGYNPSPTSDHYKALGIDWHPFQKVLVNGLAQWQRIQDTKTLQMLGKWIFANRTKYNIQQLGVYNNKVFRGGFHTGFNKLRKLSYFERF